MKFSLIFERLFQLNLFLIAILGGTVLNQLQITLELFAIIVLLFSIKWKLTLFEFLILISFIFVSVVSFLKNDIFVFFLNFKVFLIPFLILIYYKNKLVDTLIVKIFFILNIFLILFQIIFKNYLIDISDVISASFQNEIENRPLGLFLNFHFFFFRFSIFDFDLF